MMKGFGERERTVSLKKSKAAGAYATKFLGKKTEEFAAAISSGF